MQQATNIGQKLGFFDGKSPIARKTTEEMTEDDRMCCHAAWSSFNWRMVVSLFYRQPEVVAIDQTPTLPILDRWSSGRTRQSPLSATDDNTPLDISTSVGVAFTALCQLWSMLHEFLWVYYPSRMDATPRDQKWKLTEHKFREILAWTSRLPDVLALVDSRPSHVHVLHIWIHAALMDLLRPFIGQEDRAGKRLTTFAAEDNHAIYAYKASANQLKRLIMEYRGRHEASTYSILWHTGLLYLVNAMLEKPRDPDWHLYFLLCIHDYEILRRPYPISEAISKSLLEITLRKTGMPAEKARRILQCIERSGLERVDDKIRAPFVGDLEMALKDADGSSVENYGELF
ncbi:uncharacterized protein B0I36DRAFT_364163 [Microdochium trichocladiopsis]|uniref:Uncharacterized protein n=1 Tax=Microdochium trichocladiopsis TaxID=1682393 RepID=A0A9P9BTA8_9PEZI|nr:uncharacterized protein B0I36DRAFT_364163 [Microdochium trichocladiopsis]KAH7029651.1 hypothetical protein B0I36DRAFT_364163 [Microdochium trichocladiopsis]